MAKTVKEILIGERKYLPLDSFSAYLDLVRRPRHLPRPSRIYCPSRPASHNPSPSTHMTLGID